MKNSKRLKIITNLIDDLNERDILFHLKLKLWNSSFFKNNNRTPRTDFILTKKAIIFVGISYYFGKLILGVDTIPLIEIDEITCNFRKHLTSKSPFLTFRTSNCDFEILFSIFSNYKKKVRDIFREMLKVLKKNNILLIMNDSSSVGNCLKSVDINAVKTIQMAKKQRITIHTINQSNINNILSRLQVDKEIIDEIVYAVNAGNEVTVPETNINFDDWNGCGYIISDPDTGAGAHMVNGKRIRMSGDIIPSPFQAILLTLLFCILLYVLFYAHKAFLSLIIGK